MSSSNFNDYGPITWFRRTPIYATAILVAALAVGMFLTVILSAIGVRSEWFVFSPFSFWKQAGLWQLLTYPLLGKPDFFFVIGLFFFYRFGVDVERELGRTRFYQLLAILWGVPPLLLSVEWWIGLGNGYCFGSYNLSIGFFVAFASLYPNLSFWNWITMKWLAFAGIFLSTLNYLPEHDWLGLFGLLATCGVAFGYIRFLKQGVGFPAMIKSFFRRKPKFKVVPKPKATWNVHDSIDPLLEKISKSGLASLTPAEREQLQRAREALMKKS